MAQVSAPCVSPPGAGAGPACVSRGDDGSAQQASPTSRLFPSLWPRGICQRPTGREKDGSVWGGTGQGAGGSEGHGIYWEGVTVPGMTTAPAALCPIHDSSAPQLIPRTLLCPPLPPASLLTGESISHFQQSSRKSMNQSQMQNKYSHRSIKSFLLFIAPDYPCFCSCFIYMISQDLF